MALDPQWSEKLADSGGPIQPLRAGSVRNGILGTITRAITTDVRLRGRYLSIFTWGQHLVETHPSFAEASIETKKQAVFTLEKLLALTTLRYQQTTEVDSGTSGLVGKTRIDLNELLDGDQINLDSFSLRDGATAVQLTNTNRYYLYLRERETELGLTGVGEELAEAFDAQVNDYRDRLVECLIDEAVSADDLDRFADSLSLQTLYADVEAPSTEQAILGRVFLGLVSWDADAETATLDPLPESLDTRVFPYLEYEISERQFEDGLRDDVASEILRLQRAWTLFMLQTTQEYHNPTGTDLYHYQLDSVARETFDEFRTVARVYWLQEFAAVILRIHLWLVCEYLERALPRAVPRDQLFEDLSSERINAGAAAAFDITRIPSENAASQARVARELALYGQTEAMTPELEIPETATDHLTNLGDLRMQVSSALPGDWDGTPAAIRASTLVRALQQIVDPLDDVSPQQEVLSTWQQALGHSLSLLVILLDRYRSITDAYPTVDSYMRTQHGGDQVSLPQLETYLDGFDDATELTTLAQHVITDLVIDVHDRIVRDRLRNNNPIKLSFSYLADQDAYRYSSGSAPIDRDYLRYPLMQQMLLDLGLVTETGESAMLTSHGADILARARRGAASE